MRRVLLSAALLLAAAGPVGVRVERPWARATAPGQTTGVVYATLLSEAGDTLLGVASPAAGMAMVHQEVRQGGMVGMQEMGGLALPAGRPVTLAPGGMHIMLMGLRRKLVAGTTVALTLRFAQAGSVTVSVPVAPLSAVGPVMPLNAAGPAP